ncbi:MAG: sugar transferase [Dysgonamonadaceae bacterium]|jgi:exopolysaccharide biosynthesis polyprenyl glycosylphosphotransferase|nr:sugar transferase [Dysgonamonadaceae bacterium]
MNKKIQAFKYVLLDVLAAWLAWTMFFLFKKSQIDLNPIEDINMLFHSGYYLIGLGLFPAFWIFLYTMAGNYRRPYRRSRLYELGNTILIVTLGIVVVVFTLLIYPPVDNVKISPRFFVSFWIIQFTITYLFRLSLTYYTLQRIRRRKIGFPTIIVGGKQNALNIYKEMEGSIRSPGNKFIGFVNALENHNYPLSEYLEHLGSYTSLQQIIEKHKIEEVIIAIELNESDTVNRIIKEISGTHVHIKVIPNIQEILLGAVKTNSIWSPFIEIAQEPLPEWQRFLKRSMDIVCSLIAINLLLPVYIFVAIGVKRSSPGPVIYAQVRIGKGRKPFKMYKFRSMYTDAEKDGKPQLSSKDDPRITPFGRLMRKVRLDEIPQFFCVLKGDMSLVGPRPERKYYIDEIEKQAPEYRLLLNIKPGITSWGQVKFGYAENVEQMIKRLKYDLLYLENMSIVTDIKILIYTALIVIQGRGK